MTNNVASHDEYGIIGRGIDRIDAFLPGADAHDDRLVPGSPSRRDGADGRDLGARLDAIPPRAPAPR